MKTKNKNKNENENEKLLLSKSFCIFVNSTWPGGAIGGQLSLDWPRNAIAFQKQKRK